MASATLTLVRSESESLESLTFAELTKRWKREHTQFLRFSKRSTEAAWKAGRYLKQIKRLTEPHGKWQAWLIENGLKKTTAWQDCKLYDHFETAEEAAQHPLTVAKKLAGAVKDATKPVVRHDTPTAIEPPNTIATPTERAERLQKPKDATKEALQDVETINAILQRLQNEKKINWSSSPLAKEWNKTARLFRGIDSRLAAEVYGYYTTPSDALETLLKHERFTGPILEPCSGCGATAKHLERHGYEVTASDFRDQGDIYGTPGVDALSYSSAVNIVTNPPFLFALEMAEHFLSIASGKVALLLRLEILAGRGKHKGLFKTNPPARVIVLGKRPQFLKGGKEKMPTRGEYGWLVWEPGFQGKTEIVYA
jgi:hypothetical protein